MDYTYKIRRLEPQQGFMSVVYSAEGNPDIYQNFNPVDYTAEALTGLITDRAQWVVEQWETMASAPTESELAEGAEGTGTSFPRRFAEAPAHDPVTQRVVESWVVEDGTYQQVWTVEELPLNEAIASKLGEIARDRYLQEQSGVTWTDPVTEETFFLDSSLDSQNRFSAARTAIEAGIRQTSVWKCAKVTESGLELVFRMTTNEELIGWAALVHTHVQKCFDAEAAATEKVLAGDLTASFASEYALL